MRLLAVAQAFLALSTPPVLERIAVCETGMRWEHSTRDFISAFGIHRAAWADYRPSWVRPVPIRKTRGEVQPSRLEQIAVAKSIARQAGLSSWTCWRKHEHVRRG